jgi:hypothetical protein
MVKHIVMWNLKEEALGNSRKTNAKMIKEKLEALKIEIPELKYIEVGINDEDYAPKNYDVILISEFENFEDLSTYAIHPKHKEVGKFIGSVTEARTAVDYKF